MNRARVSCILAVALIAGCNGSPQQPTPAQKQQAALDNPYGYKEEVPDSVSNTKDLGKDLNDVFGP